VPACESDSTGADAVLSRRRLRSVDTMETVVWPRLVGLSHSRMALCRKFE